MNKTENLPTINTNLLPAAQEFQMFQTIAKSAKASGLYGGDENKIFMVMLAARELGIAPLLALNGGIWNIQGKIEISARLMNSMIRRAGHTMEIKSTATECTIKGKRSDTGEEHIETFTMQMAVTAGLANGNVWKKYPEDMLYNRCMSRLARRLFPDVIGCAYVEGEIREAVEAEKHLPLAECVEITQNHIQDCVNLPQVQEKISPEQVKEIIALSKQIDETCRTNMEAYLLKEFQISSYEDIPQKAFQSCVRAMKNNIDLQKNNSKQQVA